MNKAVHHHAVGQWGEMTVLRRNGLVPSCRGSPDGEGGLLAVAVPRRAVADPPQLGRASANGDAGGGREALGSPPGVRL